jgi:hypothetical protein
MTRVLKGLGIGAANRFAAAVLLVRICTGIASPDEEGSLVALFSTLTGLVLIVFGALVGAVVGFFFPRPKKAPLSPDTPSPPG